jgi:hypothetical protein
MNTFRLGIITGMSSVIVAVPFIAQITSAQTASSATASAESIPSQACVTAMADLEETHLAQFDLMNEQRKEGIQTRITALNNAAAISDDTQRKAALDQMHEDMKTQMGDMKDSIPAEMQTAMDAVKAACGDTFKIRFGEFKGDHPVFGAFVEKGAGMLADKLGMTEDELKAALESGKTIRDLAEEKGIDLPMSPRGGHMMFFNQEIDQ